MIEYADLNTKINQQQKKIYNLFSKRFQNEIVAIKALNKNKNTDEKNK